MAKEKKISKQKSTVRFITNAEHPDHAKLKATVAEIVRIGGFKCDTEIHLNFTGNQNERGKLIDEASITEVTKGKVT